MCCRSLAAFTPLLMLFPNTCFRFAGAALAKPGSSRLPRGRLGAFGGLDPRVRGVGQHAAQCVCRCCCGGRRSLVAVLWFHARGCVVLISLLLLCLSLRLFLRSGSRPMPSEHVKSRRRLRPIGSESEKAWRCISHLQLWESSARSVGRSHLSITIIARHCHGHAVAIIASTGGQARTRVLDRCLNASHAQVAVALATVARGTLSANDIGRWWRPVPSISRPSWNRARTSIGNTRPGSRISRASKQMLIYVWALSTKYCLFGLHISADIAWAASYSLFFVHASAPPSPPMSSPPASSSAHCHRNRRHHRCLHHHVHHLHRRSHHCLLRLSPLRMLQNLWESIRILLDFRLDFLLDFSLLCFVVFVCVCVYVCVFVVFVVVFIYIFLFFYCVCILGWDSFLNLFVGFIFDLVGDFLLGSCFGLIWGLFFWFIFGFPFWISVWISFCI